MSEIRRKLLCLETESFDPSLIFYAPMTQGDLTDHISGNNLNITGGTVTWNSTYNKHKVNFTARPVSQVGFWNIDFSNKFTFDGYSDSYTICARVVLDGNRPYKSRPSICGLGNWNKHTSYKPMINVSKGYEYTYPNNVEYIMSYTYIGSTRTCENWIDTEKSWNNVVAASHMSNPKNWNNSTNQCLNMFALHPIRGDGFTEYPFWISEIRMYNKRLTNAEVMALYNK